jgi:hypothetical protein
MPLNYKSNRRYYAFHPTNIERFRSLGIQNIFTLRQESEAIEEWDILANELLDHDENISRRRTEIVDHPSFNLLHYIPDLVERIHSAITSDRKVFVHWYIIFFFGGADTQ